MSVGDPGAMDLAVRRAKALCRQLEAARDAPRPGVPVEPRTMGALRGASAGAPPVYDPLEDARPLFDPGGGKMFGVLLARDRAGGEHELRAFSGMYAGRWEVPGWVAPIFEPGPWYALERRFEPEVAELGRQIHECEDAGHRRALVRRRAECSQALMARMHRLYRFVAADGRELGFEDLLGGARPSSGMGDCCAPKLICAAHRRGWEVRALAEIFVGEARNPRARAHGQVYPPCETRCEPLLPGLLCVAR